MQQPRLRRPAIGTPARGPAGHPRRLDERSAAQPVPCRPCPLAHRGIQVPRRGHEAEILLAERRNQGGRGVPRRRREARDVPQARGDEDSPRLAHQCAAAALRLSLELHGQLRTPMGVMQAVYGAVGARQRVEVGDEIGEAIDTKAAAGSERRPVNALAQQRHARDPPAGAEQLHPPPVGRDKQRDPQLRVPRQQPLHAAEGTAPQVAARVEGIRGGRRMDIVDAETYRGALAARQPAAAVAEHHGRYSAP